MSCDKLGVLVDANIFINWFNYKHPYNRLSEPIEKESLYLVVCTPLYSEYFNHLKKEYSGANAPFLDMQLKKLASEICHMEPIESSLVLMNHKDQAHLDCAHNRDNPAHLLVSDDTHFKEIRHKCPIPIILTIDEFLDDNMRERACGDARDVCVKIRQIGIRNVFSSITK